MNNRIDGEEKRKMNSRRAYEKRIYRKRRLLAGAGLVITLLFFGLGMRYVFFGDNGHKEMIIKDADVKQEDDEMSLVPNFQRGRDQTLKLPFTRPGQIKMNMLKPGTNHSISASEYAYDTKDVKDWIKGRVPYAGEKIAFLTFDDGPVENTYKVMDILKRRGVPGTFFIPGKTLEDHKNKEVLHRYIEEGHGIAVHSYSHDYALLYPGKTADAETIVEEYERTLGLMRETLGTDFDTKVFRFPGGAGSWKNIPAAQEALGRLGAYDIDWNSISGDSEPSSRRPDGPSAMADYVMETLSDQAVQDVAVVLMHDFKGITIEYLDQVIDQFIEAGYTFGILE